MYIAPGQGQTTPWVKLFFHLFSRYVYSPGEEADNSLGSTFFIYTFMQSI